MNVKNRRCIRRLSFRTLKASRKKNMIAISAIALTTLLFTTLFTIAMSLNNSYQTYTFRQIGGYSHGTFKEVNEEQIAEILAHPNIRETGRRTVIGYIDTEEFAKTPAEVSYMDKNCIRMRLFSFCPTGFLDDRRSLSRTCRQISFSKPDRTGSQPACKKKRFDRCNGSSGRSG